MVRSEGRSAQFNSANLSAGGQCLLSNPLQPLKILESRLLFIYFADIRRGAAGRTDYCSRMAGLYGFSPLREMERWLVSFGKR